MDEDRLMTINMRDGKFVKGVYGNAFCGVKTKNLWLTVVSYDNYNVTVRLPSDFDRLPNIFVEDKKRGFTKKKKPIIRALEGKPIAPKKSWLRKFNSTPTTGTIISTNPVTPPTAPSTGTNG